MCGGIKPAKSDWTYNLDAVVYKYTGYPFGGFLRFENYEKIWQSRAISVHKIPIDGFIEKGTKIIRKGNMSVVVVDDFNGSRQARIVTEPADKEVKKIHHRQPIIRGK